MSILVLGPAEEVVIRAAVHAARAHPMPWSVMKAIADESDTSVMLLGDRKVGVDEARRMYPPQHLMLGTYRIAFSFEEQPAGLMRHLSVSSVHRGKIPGMEVFDMVVPAFGFDYPLRGICRSWAEEFEPGWFAVNIVQLVEETS